MAQNKFNQRIEIVENGNIITNKLTGNKSMNPNLSKMSDYAKSYVMEQIENGLPGEYFDIEITVKKYANQKPKA